MLTIQQSINMLRMMGVTPDVAESLAMKKPTEWVQRVCERAEEKGCPPGWIVQTLNDLRPGEPLPPWLRREDDTSLPRHWKDPFAGEQQPEPVDVAELAQEMADAGEIRQKTADVFKSEAYRNRVQKTRESSWDATAGSS